MYLNGFLMGGGGSLSDFTMYVNPFLVMTGGRISKHYYIGGQRIVSKIRLLGIGEYLNFFRHPDKKDNPVAGGDAIDWEDKKQGLEGLITAFRDKLGLPTLLTNGTGLNPYGAIAKCFSPGNLGGNTESDENDQDDEENNEEGSGNSYNWQDNLSFFYHSDHLGSSSNITDITGEVYQHVEYFPFGETFVDERPGNFGLDFGYNFGTPYLYNGKELDEETGLYYYGARYYDPKISMFYGVDPMAEKYPGISPYAYVANNPLRFIDPDGNKIVDASGKPITYSAKNGWSSNVTLDVRRIGTAMMATPKGTEMFNKMMNASHNITITIDSGKGSGANMGVTHSSKSGNNIGKADIIIYEKQAQKKLNNLEETKEALDKGAKFASTPSEKTQAFIDNMPKTVDEVMASTAAHEAEHATNKAANANFETNKPKREAIANQVQIEVIKQTPEYRLEKLERRPASVSSY